MVLVVTDGGVVGIGSSSSSSTPLPLNGATPEPPDLTAAADINPAKDCSNSAMVNMRLRPHRPTCVELYAHHTLALEWRAVAESVRNILRVAAAINSLAAAQSTSSGAFGAGQWLQAVGD